MSNQLQKVQPSSLLKGLQQRVSQILPKVVDEPRFLQIILEEFRKNEKLAQCTIESLTAAIVKCSREGLEPGEECYLIPRWNGKKRVLECSYQRGYPGVLSIARRTGEFSSINLGIVHENDYYEVVEGTENKLIINRSFKDRGNVLFYWAASTTKDGEKSFEILSVEDAETHRDRFASTRDKAGNIYGPWIDNFDAMALKTVLIKHLKYKPRSYEKINHFAPEGVFELSGTELMPAIEHETSADEINEVISKTEATPNNDEKVTKDARLHQWSPAAKKIIDAADKIGSADELDKFRAGKRKDIDALGSESKSVFEYLENKYQALKQGV